MNFSSNILIKWSKALADSTDVTTGVLHAPAERFISRIENESKLLSQFRAIPIEKGKEVDIQTLRGTPRLQAIENISTYVPSQDILSDIDEQTPTLAKKVLKPAFMTAYTNISKAFLKSNIEGDSFISTYENFLVPSIRYSAENIAIYGHKPSSTPSSNAQDGMYAIDGILEQCDDNSQKGDNISDSAVVNGVHGLFVEYLNNGGKADNAHIYVGAGTMAEIRKEIGANASEYRDRVFFDGADMRLDGIPLQTIDALNTPDSLSGRTNASVIIMDPNSVAYTPLLEAEAEAEYSVATKSYLTTVDYAFDIGVIFSDDVIYADVVGE